MSVFMQKSRTRKKVKICNVVIACLCLLSVLSYFFLPFWKIEISYTLNSENISQILSMAQPPASDAPTTPLSSTSECQSAEENSTSSQSDEELLDDTEITLGVSASLTTADILSSLTQEPKQAVENVVQTNVDSLVEQLNTQIVGTLQTTLIDFIPVFVEELSKEAASSFAEYYNLRPEQVRELLVKSGFTVESMQTVAQNLLNVLFSDQLSTELLTDVLTELMFEIEFKMGDNLFRTALLENAILATTVIDEAVQQLTQYCYDYPEHAETIIERLQISDSHKKAIKESWLAYQENPTDFTNKRTFEFYIRTTYVDFYQTYMYDEQFYEDMCADYKNSFKEEWLPRVQEFEQKVIEAGWEFTAENLIYFVIDYMTDLLSKQNVETAPAYVPLAVQFLTAPNERNETQKSINPKEAVQAKLRAFIMEQVPEQSISMFANLLQHVSYYILFTMLVWLYPIIKIVVKWNAKNNTVKLKVPIWLGSLAFLLLQALPTLLIFLLKSPPVDLFNSLLGEQATKSLVETSKILSGLNASFVSCAWVSFVVGSFFVLFSIFYYAPLRRRLKKMKKGKIPVD